MNILKILRRRQIGPTIADLRQQNDFKDFAFSVAFANLKCARKDDHLSVAVLNNDVESLIDDEYQSPITAGKFSRVPGQEHILALANEEGELNIINTNLSGDLSYVHGFQAHKNAVYNICWVPGEEQIVTASGDETLALWDIGTQKKLSTFHNHTGSVKWVDFRPDSKDVFVSCSRDGSIIVWDARIAAAPSKNSSTNCIKNAHVGNRSDKHQRRTSIKSNDLSCSVTAVLFQDEQTLVSCGAADRIVKVWDMRKPYSVYKNNPLPKHQFLYGGSSNKNGFSSLVFDSQRSRVYANCMDNVIYCYDCHSYAAQPIATYKGHCNSSFYINSAISPDDRYLMSGSGGSNHAYIWKLSEPQYPQYELQGHEAEVTVVAWASNEQLTLLTAGDDLKFKIWHLWDQEHFNQHQFEGSSTRHVPPLPIELPLKELASSSSGTVLPKATVLSLDGSTPSSSTSTATPKPPKRKLEFEKENRQKTPMLRYIQLTPKLSSASTDPTPRKPVNKALFQATPESRTVLNSISTNKSPDMNVFNVQTPKRKRNIAISRTSTSKTRKTINRRSGVHGDKLKGISPSMNIRNYFSPSTKST